MQVGDKVVIIGDDNAVLTVKRIHENVYTCELPTELQSETKYGDSVTVKVVLRDELKLYKVRLLELFRDNQTEELLTKMKAEGVRVRQLTNTQRQYWKEVQSVVLPVRYVPVYDTLTDAAKNNFDIGVY